MAKGYIVTTYRAIHDTEKLAAYAKLAGPAVQRLEVVFSFAGTQ
jgi:hypothetical protein